VVPTRMTEGDCELPTGSFPAAFGKGWTVASFLKNRAIFTQGSATGAVLSIEAGRFNRTVVPGVVRHDRIAASIQQRELRDSDENQLSVPSQFPVAVQLLFSSERESCSLHASAERAVTPKTRDNLTPKPNRQESREL